MWEKERGRECERMGKREALNREIKGDRQWVRERVREKLWDRDSWY